MESLCKICGGKHPTGACQEFKKSEETTKSYDFSTPIENFQYFKLDPAEHKKMMEGHEKRKEAMSSQMQKDLTPVLDNNPQISQDGKLNFAVIGSYVYLLTGVADEMKMMRMQKDGTLTETEESVGIKSETAKSMAVLPGDVDLVKYNEFNFQGEPPDNFEGLYNEGDRFVEYKIGDKKIIGQHPMDQLVKSWVGFTHVLGPEYGIGDAKKIKNKASRYEMILKALLQSYDVEEIANRIVDLYIKKRFKNNDGEGIGQYLLTKPEMMRDMFEQKGTKYEFEMEPDKYSALLTLMKRVSEIAKEKIPEKTSVNVNP